MDVEQAIQFLLEQQARFDARLEAQRALFQEEISKITSVLRDLATTQERTNAILATLAERHVDLVEAHKGLVESHKALVESHKNLAESHKNLAESHKALAESHKALAESHKALAESHSVTEQNLNSLITMFERHIADHP